MPTNISCPACHSQFSLPEGFLVQPVRCPACHTTLSLHESTDALIACRGEASPTRGSAQTIISEPTYAAESHQQIQLPPAKVDRRTGCLILPDEIDEALRTVHWPASAFIILGCLSLALSIVLPIFDPALSPRRRARPENVAHEDAGYPLSFCWGAIVLAGGIQMKKLRSYNFVLTSSLVALFPVSCCWPVAIPFAIWTMTILALPHVKNAFD